MRVSNPSARTFLGSGLKEPPDKRVVSRKTTTRKFDVEHYKRTNELIFLDEGAETTERQDAIQRAKDMRNELTTIEQFEAIGTYSEVAKKYEISKKTTHAHMMSLRYKKDREEKEMIGPANIEVSVKPIASIGEQNGGTVELEESGVGDCEEKGIDEACGGMSEEENMTDEEWEEQIKEPTVEDKWDEVGVRLAGLKEILVDIRRMKIKQIEAEIGERLGKMMEGIEC